MTTRKTIKVTLPRLHPSQREVAKSTARYIVLCAGRRWGKTLLGAVLCMRTALNGGRAWWVAPSYPMSRVGWRALVRIASQIPYATIYRGDRHIDLLGGEIWVRSADDPQSLRGDGLDYVVLDEAAYMREEAWSQALRPALADRQGRALLISTPNGLNWYHDLYMRAQERDDWEVRRYPTSANPHISAAELDEARRELPELVYMQEFLAEFVDLRGAGIFRSAWYRYYDEPPPCERVTIGVDLAISRKTTADYTVIAVVGAHEGKYYILDIARDRYTMQETIDRIRVLAERYNASTITVEAVGYQQVIADELARSTMYAIKPIKPATDKVTRATPLASKYEQGLVYHPRNAAWLRAYEDELLAFPVGEHDDQIDAVAYAYNLARETAKNYEAIWI